MISQHRLLSSPCFLYLVRRSSLCTSLPERLRYCSTNSTFEDHVRVSVIFTSTILPINDFGPLKFTTLFFSVYPARTSGSFLLSPSTSTLTILPLSFCIDSADCLFTSSFKRCRRSFFTSVDTLSSLAAAGVPSRGE